MNLSLSSRKSMVHWLSLSLPVFSLFSLTAMAPMNIALGLVVLAFVLLLAFNVPPTKSFLEVQQSKTDYYFFATILVFACLISVIASTDWPFSYAGHPPTQDAKTLVKLLHLTFPILYLTVFMRNPNLERILKTWWVTTLILGVLAVVQFFTGLFHKQEIPTSPGYYHATLLFGHHLSTASIILFPAFSALAVALGEWVRTKKILRLEWIAGWVGILILFLSFARAAWVAIPIGILMLLIWGMKGFKIKKMNLMMLAATLVLVLAGIFQSPAVQSRIQNNMGIQDRFRLWEANLDYFSHRPLTGIGFLKTQEMSQYYFLAKDPEHYKDYFWGHAHSNFFEMLGGTGLIGFLAFLAWIYFSLKLTQKTISIARANDQHRLGDLAFGLGVALVLMHINGLTQVNFWEGKVFHQQMFGIGLLLMIQYKSLISSNRNS